ncbi:C-terminal binding protein [Peribacillus acanthi]|uniref:C-terminal binding protein n=1 Tax=Peribacillus acanthi TaxID=2171554 RepID=UPI000D3E8D35|nr:C-terminal binding protein [Peribacillus acanthi]
MAENPRLKIVIINANYPNYEAEKEELSSFPVDITHINTSWNSEDIIPAVRLADAILVRETPLNAEVIQTMEKCKVIVRYGVGVDNIDLSAARDKKIFVANVPDYGSEEVADHAVALMFAVARRVVTRDRDVRKGRWNVGDQEPVFSFNGKTLGVVGFGRIGQTFCRKVSGLGFGRILVNDPFAQEQKDSIELVDLETLCREADIISLHAPLMKENYHLIDSGKLTLMKPNTVLINTSRGGLIDENALTEALLQKQIFGAGIDVFETEPPNLDNPLFNLDNVVVTDHTGWYSRESLQDLQKKAAREIVRVLSGDTPKSWVNRWED